MNGTNTVISGHVAEAQLVAWLAAKVAQLAALDCLCTQEYLTSTLKD